MFFKIANECVASQSARERGIAGATPSERSHQEIVLKIMTKCVHGSAWTAGTSFPS